MPGREGGQYPQEDIFMKDECPVPGILPCQGRKSGQYPQVDNCKKDEFPL